MQSCFNACFFPIYLPEIELTQEEDLSSAARRLSLNVVLGSNVWRAWILFFHALEE